MQLVRITCHVRRTFSVAAVKAPPPCAVSRSRFTVLVSTSGITENSKLGLVPVHFVWILSLELLQIVSKLRPLQLAGELQLVSLHLVLKLALVPAHGCFNALGCRPRPTSFEEKMLRRCLLQSLVQFPILRCHSNSYDSAAAVVAHAPNFSLNQSR